ncbi:MAG: phosphate transport system protein [Candidatus Cloacimonadota bacterium]|nr:phosphate transport system protein [Candidatus Cloacimonadota bacterium]
MESANLVKQMLVLSIINTGLNREGKLAEVLILEEKVNRLEVEIDKVTINLIALYQPEAIDLRRILMMYRINTDLERLGDQAVNIAQSAEHIDACEIKEQELFQMQELTLKMFGDAITAFLKEDVNLAQAVCAKDQAVDDLNKIVYKQVLQHIQANPGHADFYLHTLRIAKNLERSADLATNIAENTIYLSQGKQIKHHWDQA